ncbi:MAG TPA: hypothetical protein VGJ26_19495, partial [Pirellulales bacterium]
MPRPTGEAAPDLRLVTALPNITRMMMTVTNVGALVGLLLVPTIVIALVLLRAARQLRGTTLTAPLAWGGLALTAICGVELLALAAGEESAIEWLQSARFVAAVSSLCPAIALLGAKRPQSRAWQFIVLTLLGILALPALFSLLLHYGEPF